MSSSLYRSHVGRVALSDGASVFKQLMPLDCTAYFFGAQLSGVVSVEVRNANGTVDGRARPQLLGRVSRQDQQHCND